MRSTPIWLTAALLAAVPALAGQTTASGQEEPSSVPMLNVAKVQGCYSHPGELVAIGVIPYNSKDECSVKNCKAQGKAVAATMGGAECFCGDKYPPHEAQVEDSKCDMACTGWPYEACGGNFYYTVYNTGLTMAVRESDADVLSATDGAATTSKSTKATSATTVVESAVVTVSTTNTPTPGKSSGNSGGSTNTAGIAAGVVVGVVAVAGIMGGIFFFMRRRRNKELEEKHRRNAAISTFFPGKPPGSSGGYSGSDARLDPVMAQRRVSNGSIADNEDYSRKILRVTNA